MHSVMSGVYIYIILRKHQNRKEMSSAVGKNSLTQISFRKKKNN